MLQTQAPVGPSRSVESDKLESTAPFSREHSLFCSIQLLSRNMAPMLPIFKNIAQSAQKI